MTKKNPKHAGKIPYATLARQVKAGAISQDSADALVISGAAAPSPRQEKFGDLLPLVLEAEAAIAAVQEKAAGRLTLRVLASTGALKARKPKAVPKAKG